MDLRLSIDIYDVVEMGPSQKAFRNIGKQKWRPEPRQEGRDAGHTTVLGAACLL